MDHLGARVGGPTEMARVEIMLGEEERTVDLLAEHS
ncbi:MAG: hypothetical protein QOJ66_870 [Ilumatobacteraceae bacterium]|jgi:hypothetical protein